MRDISSPLDGFSSPFGPQRNRTLQSLLFGQTEPGFTFEPWDITTLFQDRAGTTPVTAAGQSVGLRLSKDQGLRIGPELVTNGDFTNPVTTGWGAVFATLSVVSGKLRITGTNAAQDAAGSYSISGLTIGRAYLVTGLVSPGTRGNVRLEPGTGLSASWIDTRYSETTVTFVAIATSTTGNITIRTAFACPVGQYIEADNISVRELAGNHEVAVSDAKRGVYGWMPKTGRRNLLTYSEQFDNAVWVKIKGGLGITPTVTPGFTDPDGGNAAWRLVANSGGSGVSDYSVMRQTLASTDGARSIYIKSNTGASQIIYFGAPLSGSALTVTTSWTRVTFNAVTASLFFDIGAFPSTAAGGSGTTADVLIWHPQLEVGSTTTAYQRVVSQYDITEAGVPTCYYVQADGVDDAYVTPTITPNTDKVQVFAGVRKLSDATTGALLESSVDAGSNAGTILLLAPDANASPRYGFYSRGSVASGVASSPSSSFAAPISNVVTGIGDISADVRTIRINASSIGTSSSDQGTGNYLAYPVYIYGRGGTSLPFNGLDFGHAVRFGPNLDAATIARVEALIARNTPEVTL